MYEREGSSLSPLSRSRLPESLRWLGVVLLVFACWVCPSARYDDIDRARRRLSLWSNPMRRFFFKENVEKAKSPNHFASKHGAAGPIYICDRLAPVNPQKNLRVMKKYYALCSHMKPPEETRLLLLEGVQTFGRTGNNLIEFLHALQYGHDNGVVVGVMRGSWPMHLITSMWMAVQNDNMHAWSTFFQDEFCVRIIEDYDELESYREVIAMDTRQIFQYKHFGGIERYVEFQTHYIRVLFRSYNRGIGKNIRHGPVKDMCSVLHTMFGDMKSDVKYSVIHSRSLEGDPGRRLLARIAEDSGCDPTAAIDMTPEYVKGILEPLGMLDHPIVFISDHQDPTILDRLKNDATIGSKLVYVPDEDSWVGGDMTLAIMANVFIGNPASTFSGFIAKSRLALGWNNSFMFRRKNEDGRWEDVCDDNCIFNKKVMHAMA
mmetsp:Transcript_23056/g.54389  ORF Transcript_23056/g.54389 Transcript_23056/m.54389 type:complete len:432 (-) Transcript_23056:201-1496(-)